MTMEYGAGAETGDSMVQGQLAPSQDTPSAGSNSPMGNLTKGLQAQQGQQTAETQVDTTSQPAGQEGASTVQGGASSQQAVDWNSPQNPYAFAAQQLHQQLQQYQQQDEQRRMQMEQQFLVQRGVDPRQAEAAVTLKNQQMQMQRQQEQLDQAARPLAAQRLTEQIKTAYGVDITPNELLTASSGQEIQSVQEMLARADAIVTERRKSTFDQRQRAGADRTGKSEGGLSAFDANSLRGKSPTSILAMGLARMKQDND